VTYSEIAQQKTAIVVDDEKNLLDHLVKILNEVWPELKIVGTASSGQQALALVTKHNPDIAFLDIQMPGLSGLEVAEKIHVRCKVVFVTAFDEYAVEAFENAAIDYVLKPATSSRLTKTVERLKAQPDAKGAQSDEALMGELLAKLSRPGGNSWLQWIRAGSDNQTELISVEDVVYFEADNKYTTLYTATAEYLVRVSISKLSEQLDPEQFWRIHRSIIVKVSEIDGARRDIRGRYTLTMKNHTAKLRSSPRYGHLFKLSN